MTDRPKNDRRFYFLVGAPRSGTKILRDTLKQSPRLAATEHNLNASWETEHTPKDHEEFRVSDLRGGDADAIRERVAKYFYRDTEICLEKNVSHSLRMDFVSEVFPGAKFIHIHRDGRDAVCSIRERWRNPIEWDYFLSRKLFELPYTRLPGFVLKHLRRQAAKWISGEKHVSTWGPVFEGMRGMVDRDGLFEVCLEQWRRCVQYIMDYRERNPEKIHDVRYESLMNQPEEVLPGLASFMGLDEDLSAFLDFSGATYRTDSIGRWTEQLTPEEQSRVDSAIGDELNQLGYPLEPSP